MDIRYNTLVSAAFKKEAEVKAEEQKQIVQLYELEERQKIYAFAEQKKILPFAANLLSTMDLDKEFWLKILEHYEKRNQKILEELDHLFRKLYENGVKKIFVTENFGAVLASDAEIGLFASGDVDLYAEIDEKEKIYDIFREAGYSIEERYTFQRLINTNFRSLERFPDGFYFSVAWEPLSRTKLPCFVAAENFLEWGACTKARNTAVTIPDRNALMYICLLHVSLHSFSRAPDIRLYIDIKNLSLGTIDWDWIMRQARNDGTTIRVLASCILANKLVCAKIPAQILSGAESRNKKLRNLLSLVYNDKNNCLLYEPNRAEVFLIEIMSDDRPLISSLFRMLFPEQMWIRETYLSGPGSLLLAYCRHLRNLC